MEKFNHRETANRSTPVSQIWGPWSPMQYSWVRVTSLCWRVLKHRPDFPAMTRHGWVTRHAAVLDLTPSNPSNACGVFCSGLAGSFRWPSLITTWSYHASFIWYEYDNDMRRETSANLLCNYLVDSYSGRSRDMKICHANQAPDLLGQLNSSLEYVA